MSQGDKCSMCGGETQKVIYAGAPGRFCRNEDCACLSGLACHVASIYFNGVFMYYTGSYWRALWYWLKGDWLKA